MKMSSLQHSLTCVSVLQDHHDKTLEALKHAKKAHLHAMQAQASLRSAQEAQQNAEAAQRKKQEVSLFCPIVDSTVMNLSVPF